MRLVFTNGTFDILHPGHIELFKVGASLGDRLIVATDTDEKIKQELLAAEKARDANNYEILHVEMTASEKQLKVAYRKACLKWHPDKHNNGEDAQYRANCMFKVKLHC